MNLSRDRSAKLPIDDNVLPKNPNPQKIQTAEKLVEALGSSNDVLFRATTVFPLTLFRDTVTIDRAKISITHRDFFSVGEVLGMNIEDVLNVTATVGPFFGSIHITTRFYDHDKKEPYALDHLWRADALKIKRIMQGYIAATQKKVDCSALSTQELAKMLDELGKVGQAEKV
ncbi:MAG: hypothetical protein V4702_05685 [Patescibacteria group bacterium]